MRHLCACPSGRTDCYEVRAIDLTLLYWRRERDRKEREERKRRRWPNTRSVGPIPEEEISL